VPEALVSTLRLRFIPFLLLFAVTLIAATTSVPKTALGKPRPRHAGRSHLTPKQHFGSVDVTPYTKTLTDAETEVDVDIFFCGEDDQEYVDDFSVTLDEVDVTGSFSQVGNGNQDFGCEMWWEWQGSLPIAPQPGEHYLEARVRAPFAGSWSGSANFSRPYRLQQVRVVANPTYRTVAAGSSGNSQTFTIWNTGLVEANYNVAAACSGSAVSSCSLSSSSIHGVAMGDSTNVTVTFTGGSNGTTGTIRVIATDSSTAAPVDTAIVDVTAQTAASTGAILTRSLATRRRGACVTVAVASDAAMECGDLRITHALPGVTTMGVGRTPVLVYNSALARPILIAHADVTLPCPLPTTVTAVTYIGGSAAGYQIFNGSDWACGSTRRVTIDNDGSPYGSSLQTYYVDITGTGGGGGHYVSNSSTLAAVDRAGSAFGAGWWLAGLERLVIVNSSTILWVGGDGSTAVYSGGSGTFVAAAFDRPDTITYNSGTGEYTRQGAGNVDVKFNSSGYHVSTTNRQGQVTRFTYVSGTDRLDSLVVPVRSGSPLVYKFAYTSGLLDSIIAPTAGAARNVKLNHSGATVTSIRDPDGTTVSFGYLGGIDANLISSRTDRRSKTTYFTYNSFYQLAKDSLDLGSGQFVRQILRPAESASISNALSPEASYTSIDGPRSDVADITRIWVNQFGQPTLVRDGEGDETVLKYDSTWPGLVNEMRSPARLVTHSFYSSTTGLTDSTVSYSPLGGANAVTKYTWNTTWRAPVSITSPTGVIDSMAYDGSGNRSWAQTGGSSHRVTFTYTSDNLDSAVTLPSGVGSPVTKIVHDHLGNDSIVINPKGHRSFSFNNAIGQPIKIGTPLDSAHASTWSSDSTYYRIVTKAYSIAGRDSVSVTSGPSVTLPSPYSTTVTTEPLTVSQTYDAEGNPVATRRSFSYNGSNTTLIDSTIYDAAGRVTYSLSPASGKGYTLDPAGNVTGITDGRGYTVSMTYDRANRMTTRIVPQVTDDSLACTSTGIDWPVMGCGYYLPTVGGAVCIDADTARFGYNGVGRLLTASNKYARVTRTYNPNESIKSEVQGIRNYYEPQATPCHTAVEAGTDFNNFTVSYTYDLSGNRTGLETPVTTGCSGTCTTTWNYSGTTGLLSSVVDENAGTSSFTYDDANRLTTISTPDSWTDTRTLDALGQTSLRVVQKSGAYIAISDTLAYDPAGRIKRAGVGYRAGGSGLPIESWYNPHGAVLAATGATTATGGTATELFLVDAIGNRRYTMARNLRPQTHPDVNAIRTSSFNGNGQLLSITRDTTTFSFDQGIGYDWSGNVSQTNRTELDYQNSSNLWVVEKSWYTADDKLSIFNRAVGPLADDETHPGEHTVFEEYRYDAFGRRVGTRRRMAWSCTNTNSDCASTWTRTVWDGDQILVEIRAPGAYGTGVSAMENGAPTGVSTDAYPYGRVRYVHAGGIDQPIAVLRYGMTGITDPYIVYPHANWRGQFESGHIPNGTLCYSGSSCVEIAWPGAVTSVDGARENPTTGHAWFGSLITGGADGSGMIYQRNRYYDPQTGRFTQEDPIGLAGGVNAYGFAGGDRVNFGDPFGLCPPKNFYEVFVCTGQILKPAQAPLEIAGMVVTAPLAGGMGMMGRVAGASQLGRAAAVAAPTARVLGHHPEYLQVGEAIGAKTFNIASDVWNSMSSTAQWAANKQFLDDGIREGAEFVMATRRADVRAGSMLAREVQYLSSNGYKWAENGLSMIKK
jgi:RHS repeat-associated protein